MYQATKALKASASKRFNSRRVEDLIGWLVRPAFFIRVAEVEQLQGALKKLIDLFFAHFVRGEQLLQVEVREAAVGHASGQKFAQAAGIHRSHIANLLENNPVQRVVKDSGIKQFADLCACPALDQHRTEKAQRVFLELESGICVTNAHIRL